MAYNFPWLANTAGNGIGMAALNLQIPSYYTNVYPFINMTRHGSGWNTTGTVNANKQVIGLANGQTADFLVFNGEGKPYHYFPSGSFFCKAVATGSTTCEARATTNVSSITTGSSRGTFVVGSDPTDMYLEIRVTNTSGSSINITDLKVGLVSDETDIDAGEIFNPVFLSFVSNCESLRTMDWTNTNINNITQASDLRSESSLIWSLDYAGQGEVPYSVIAKLGAKTGKKIWVCLPLGTTKYGWSVSGSTFTIYESPDKTYTVNHGIAENEEIRFCYYSKTSNVGIPAPLSIDTSYYAKNVTATTLQVSATPGGSAITITGTASEPYSKVTTMRNASSLFQAIADEMYAAAPGIHVIVEYANEVWNGGGRFPYHQLGALIDTYSSGSGTANGDDTYAYLAMKCWKAFETAGYSRSKITRMYCGQNAVFTALGNGLDYVDPGIIQNGTAVKNLVDEYGVAPYVSFFDNDYLVAQGADAKNDAWWYDLFISYGSNGAGEETVGWLASTMATNKTSLAAKNSSIKLTTYECGFQFINTATNSAIKAREIEWLESASARSLYEYYYSQVFTANNVTRFNHYFDAAGVNTETGMAYWGLAKNHAATTIPRVVWFNTLPKT